MGFDAFNDARDLTYVSALFLGISLAAMLRVLLYRIRHFKREVKMDSNSILTIGASSCSDEDDEQYSSWYNDVHIPMVLKYKGIRWAGRFKRLGDDKNRPKYLVLYEFENKEAREAFEDSPELAEAVKDMEQTWEEGRIDLQWLSSYEPVKIWDRK